MFNNEFKKRDKDSTLYNDINKEQVYGIMKDLTTFKPGIIWRDFYDNMNDHWCIESNPDQITWTKVMTQEFDIDDSERENDI